MNGKGLQFIKDISKKCSEYNQLKNNNKNLPTLPNYNWSDSSVQERIMRLGREAVFFEISNDDTNGLESIAIATLYEDFLNRQKNNKQYLETLS